MKNKKEQKKTKILFFLPNCLGGSEHVLITIAKHLDQKRFDIIFVIVSSKTNNVLDILPKGYNYLHIKVRNIWEFSIIKLVCLMRREKPDIVFSSLIYLNIRIIIAAKIVGKIKIIIRNNIPLHKVFSSPIKSFNHFMMKHLYKYADVIIAQQEEMKQEIVDYCRVTPDKVKVLQNPLDTELIDSNIKEPSPFPKETEKQIKFIWTARVTYEKGFDILIKAFQIVHIQIPNSHLYILGKYSENDQFYQSLIKDIEEFHLKDFIHFIGYDKNPHRWVKNSDCFVQPSRIEGLPNALVEAMYIGIPVVATRCIPVINRIVKDGYSGYIVNPENIRDLADAMIKALELKNFTITYKSATIKEFQQLFEQL